MKNFSLLICNFYEPNGSLLMVVQKTFEPSQNKCVIVLHSDLLSWVVHAI
jgi:hypothetical protein